MTPVDTRAEAVAWLVGRLRFEQLLQDLQAGAGTRVEPVAGGGPATNAA